MLCMRVSPSPPLMGYKSFSNKGKNPRPCSRKGIHMKNVCSKGEKKISRVSNGQEKLYSNKKKISIILPTTSCLGLGYNFEPQKREEIAFRTKDNG